jgi:signal transduction histidine kinase/ActR/RegA family two-component response regulator
MSQTSSAPLTWRIGAALSDIVAAIAAGALIGWAIGSHLLTAILPSSAKMSATTAVCLIFAAISLQTQAWLNGNPKVESERARDWLPKVGQICAGGVALVGLLRLMEAMTGWSLSVDSALFSEASATAGSVRMASATALNLVLFGSALLLARTRFLWSFQFVTLLGGLVAWLGLSQYLYGGVPLVPLAQMAVNTAASFFILGAGILCLRTDGGLMELLTAEGSGGVMARSLVPAVLLIPPVLGWLRLRGQREGWYGDEGGVALFAVVNITTFGAIVWVNAALLHRSDGERKKADGRVLAQLERLSLLQQITRSIGERHDMRSIFQAVIGRLEDHLPMDFCCVCLFDAASQELSVASVAPACLGLARELGMTPGERIGIDENGLSRCIRGHLVYEPDASEIAFPFPRQLASVGIRAVVATPLSVESQVFGLLLFARREAASFSSGECEFLRQLSEHVALAAHQAELHGALKQAYDDLRTTQEAVMQQERLRVLGQMASGIAHDINNAVAPVSLYTEMLLEKNEDLSPRVRNYLEITQRALGDVSQTIGRMGEFYRQSPLKLQFEPTDLNRLIHEVVDLTRARWSDMPQQRGIVIDVRKSLTPELPLVPAIASEIREALTNLVFNAVDAMPDGGRLTLRTRSTTRSANGAPERLVCVEIADNGTGMDEATRRRCLEPFFTTKGERGTGLGLAMVYGIVRRHNAELEFDSEVGKGTTVRLVFPAAAPGNRSQPALTDSMPTRRRILLVDDDPLVLNSLRDTLEHDGHTVVAANGGREGLAAFQEAEEQKLPFAVVITDLGMPHVDGRKVAATVKAASPSTPVILLTGWGQRLSAEGDLPPHVDRMLNKPPRLRELREALNSVADSVA